MIIQLECQEACETDQFSRAEIAWKHRKGPVEQAKERTDAYNGRVGRNSVRCAHVLIIV